MDVIFIFIGIFAMIMKKILTIIWMSVFLITTIGIDVNAHFCEGVLTQFAVNGLPIHANHGNEMPGCMDDGCPLCKSIHHAYQVHSQYGIGQVISSQPAPSISDWFHGDLPSLALMSISVVVPSESDADNVDFYYLPRSHPWSAYPSGGFRGPPVA